MPLGASWLTGEGQPGPRPIGTVLQPSEVPVCVRSSGHELEGLTDIGMESRTQSNIEARLDFDPPRDSRGSIFSGHHGR